MSYTEISGTPLEIVLTYRHVDDPTDSTINLQESAAAIIRGVVMGMLPQSAQQFLQQPLDVQFASLWATQQSSISTLVRNAVLSSDSTVTNIEVGSVERNAPRRSRRSRAEQWMKAAASRARTTIAADSTTTSFLR
jgi:hypothetical protein